MRVYGVFFAGLWFLCKKNQVVHRRPRRAHKREREREKKRDARNKIPHKYTYVYMFCLVLPNTKYYSHCILITRIILLI